MTLPNEFTVYGSEEMLKPLILQLLAQHYDQGGEAVLSGGNSRPLPYYVKGKCIVSLHFKGIIDKTIADHEVEKSFRLVNDDPSTMSQSRLLALTQKVYEKFSNFNFRTGQEAFCYNEPEAGFNRVWGFFENVTNAKKLFEQMLDVSGGSPKWKKLTRSVVVEPGDRFNEPPERVMQLSQSVRTSRERPFATVKFKYATIKFPHIRKPIEIIKSNGAVLKGLQFLNDSEIKGTY